MTPKPIIHGFDHAPGGADPAPGLGGIQFGGPDPVYGPNNLGAWLDVATTDSVDVTTFGDIGIQLLATGDPHGAVLGSTGIGNTYLAANDGSIYICGLGGGALTSSVYFVGDGTGTYLNVDGFKGGMDFLDGGYTNFDVAGFEVDSTAGIYISNTSADGINISADGGNSAGHDVNIHADHRVAVTAGEDLNMTASGSVLLRAVGASGMTLYVDDSPIILTAVGGTTEASIQARVSNGNYFWVGDQNPTTEIFRVTSAGSGNPGKIRMANMGTVNPGISGQLWNNGGVVNIA